MCAENKRCFKLEYLSVVLDQIGVSGALKRALHIDWERGHRIDNAGTKVIKNTG